MTLSTVPRSALRPISTKPLTCSHVSSWAAMRSGSLNRIRQFRRNVSADQFVVESSGCRREAMTRLPVVGLWAAGCIERSERVH